MERYLDYVNGETNDPNGAQGIELASEVSEACGYKHDPERLKKWIMNLKLYSLEKEALEDEKRANQ